VNVQIYRAPARQCDRHRPPPAPSSQSRRLHVSVSVCRSAVGSSLKIPERPRAIRSTKAQVLHRHRLVPQVILPAPSRGTATFAAGLVRASSHIDTTPTPTLLSSARECGSTSILSSSSEKFSSFARPGIHGLEGIPPDLPLPDRIAVWASDISPRLIDFPPGEVRYQRVIEQVVEFSP